MRSFFPATLRVRFALIMGVTLIPVLAAAVFSYYREKQVLVSHVHEDVMRVARTAAGIQETAINSARQLLTALAEGLVEDAGTRTRLFSTVQSENPVYAAIGLVQENGTVIGTTSGVPTSSLRNRMHADGDTAVDVWTHEDGRKSGLILSLRLSAGGGATKGTLFVALDVARLYDYTDLQLPDGSEYVLVTENGTILAAGPESLNRAERDSPLIKAVLSGREGVREMKGLDGQDRLYAFRPLSTVADTGMYITIGFPTSVTSELDTLLVLDMLVLALSLLAGVTIWSLTESVVIRDTNALVAVARRLSEGEMHVRTALGRGPSGEMEQIARALDRMAEALEQRADQLYSHQERLRSMASELLLVEERERRRIAVEMHDQIGHSLAMAKIRLREIIRAAEADRPGAKLVEAGQYVDQAILDTRSIIHRISSPILYELGLEAALECAAEQIGEKHGIRTVFKSDECEKPLEEDVSILLFQAVNELLVNVVKHAGARNIMITCDRDGNEIRIEVEDDGCGFDPSRMEKERRSAGGFGLFSIRERLHYVKGSMEIASSPGKGTKVILKTALDNTRSSNTP